MGGEPRKLTDVAIDSALHQLPEPQNGWRNHLPPEDLGAMVSSGSGQITLQACIAALHYGDRAYAVRTLRNYAELCPRRFMLSEPWSLIYGKAIVCCWAAVVVIADRHGEHELADLFRDLISRWAGTCALMESRGKVLAAGCRGWGHEISSGGFGDLWKFARGATPPKPGTRAYGRAGADDDWGWLNRCAWIAWPTFTAAASPYLGRDWRSLLPSIPRWGARTDMQLLGWEDGSRLWIMEDDPNGNTPGLLVAGVLGGKVVALPKWPNPFDGLERLRQTKCTASVDGSPETGWTLFHSHLGEKRIGTGFTTSLPAYTASPLAFWVLVENGALVWSVKYPSSVLHPDPPIVPEPGANVPKPGKKPSWIERAGL